MKNSLRIQLMQLDVSKTATSNYINTSIFKNENNCSITEITDFHIKKLFLFESLNVCEKLLDL